MKLKDGFMIRQLGDQHVAVPIGLQTNSFKGMIKLNDTAATLWKALAKHEQSEDQLADLLVATFGTTRETALTDVREFVAALVASDLLV